METNLLGAARATDKATCTGVPAKNFIVTGSSHVLSGGATRISGGGVTLAEWIRRMSADEPTWQNVAP